MLFHTPYWLKALGGNGLTWEMPAGENNLYLTFDDGPDPETTPYILDLLDRFAAKATFFCVGENVNKNPDLYQQIIDKGHAVGNHSCNHLKGWVTDTKMYVENVEKCSRVVKSTLFRPPYGKITRSQRKALKDKYNIIMWSVLSRDYDPKVSRENCLEKTWKYSKPGAIIVFHDHQKALSKLQYVLPAYLEKAIDSGYHFKALGVGR
ncbi:MAG: polysaccharide deacetylase family protein [Bacteroidota bacterium]